MKTCPQCSLRYPSESTYCFVDGAQLVRAPDERIGSTIAGRYVLEDVLGKGGMATVYRARAKLVDRACAIKILALQLAQDEKARERFRREARHAQRLAHPNIIEITDEGETEDGAPFMVMELLEGTSLALLIARSRVPLARALPMMVQMTRALGRAHDFEVVHRDLKPENVYVLPGDRIKLLDFGIARCAQDARLTALGEVFGTPHYMAPECSDTMDVGPAADLYSLGVLFFEMLTQVLPFDAPDPATVLVKHKKEAPPRLRAYIPEAPDALDRLIFELMAKDPAERPVDAHRVLRNLCIIADGTGIPIPAVDEPERAPITTVGGTTLDRWSRRADLFERMLAQRCANGEPHDLAQTLDALKRRIEAIRAIGAKAMEVQAELEGIDAEGREGRSNIGAAMDELSIDVSKAREEARQLRAAVAPLHTRARAHVSEVLALHADALKWEGRSAFTEPYAQLAESYRQLAEAIDAWHDDRQKELEADTLAVQQERLVADFEYQIRELRTSLTALERRIAERRHGCLHAIADLGIEADRIETELLHLASRFCAPLRNNPELGDLFSELERDVVSSAPNPA